MTSAPAPRQVEISDTSRLVPDPVVSVLVLAYKHATFLTQTLESILGQDVDFPFEIIVGEDCSPDATRAVAESFQQRHPDLIRVVTANRNVGMQSNHSRILAAARGSILAYCEGDDYWTSTDKLATQVAMLKADPALVAVHSDFMHLRHVRGRWRGLDYFWRSLDRPVPQGQVFVDLVAGNFVQTCTLAIRTEAVRAYQSSGLPVDSYLVGDWPQCLYASTLGAIAYVDQSWAAYRLVPGSATKSGTESEVRRAHDAARMTEDLIRHVGAEGALVVVGQRGAWRHVLATALKAGDRALLFDAVNWLRDHDGLSAREVWIFRTLARVPGLAVVAARFWRGWHAVDVRRRYRASVDQP